MNDSKPIALGTTPFPNVLIDRAMPRLSDTSFRVLSVVVRQTFGYRSPNGARKKSDWLSHRQLKFKTGRSSSAISEAIDHLVESRLISVATQAGLELSSKAQRRQFPGHLMFSLHKRVIEASLIGPLEDIATSDSGINKRKPNTKKKLHDQTPLNL